MKSHDIIFSAAAAGLSLTLFLLLVGYGAFSMPRELRDPRWGTLPEFEAALRPIHCGTPCDVVTNLLAGKPWNMNTAGEVTCLWESQPHGYFKEPTMRRFTFVFGPDGSVTNILIVDNEKNPAFRSVIW